MVKIAYHSKYILPVPANHRFPMTKYELITMQLLHHGIIEPKQIFEPENPDINDILLTHSQEYVDKLLSLSLTDREMRRIGFEQTHALIERELLIMQGGIDCARFALEYGIALNVAGGTHHAFSNKGEGFCILNDHAVAANFLLKNRMINKILIIDLDVHQGNGTAEIFAKNKNVLTLSIHGKHNYPFIKECSDWDIPVNDGIEDDEYLALVKMSLNKAINTFKPDFIMFQSGVDILSSDKFGKFKVSMQGCKKRDEIVIGTCKKLDIPCIAAMGGGYSEDIKLIVQAHCQTFETAMNYYA